jgi:hypothetical protein
VPAPKGVASASSAAADSTILREINVISDPPKITFFAGLNRPSHCYGRKLPKAAARRNGQGL